MTRPTLTPSEQRLVSYRLQEAEETVQALNEKERYCKDMLQELRFNPRLNGEHNSAEDGYFVRSGTCYIKLKRGEIERLVRTNYQQVVAAKSNVISEVDAMAANVQKGQKATYPPSSSPAKST